MRLLAYCRWSIYWTGAPRNLSGGQRQRVAIGRAIVRNPQVFLFDEPLSNLDAAMRMDMRMEIAKLHQEPGATMIYVTHDQVEAMTLADKIVVLKKGQVMQLGSHMELYHEPANLFVAGFLGAPSMNFIDVTVEELCGEAAVVLNQSLQPIEVALRGQPLAEGDHAILGVRPQYLDLSDSTNNMLNGTVGLTERLGSETVIDIALDDGSRIMAALPEDRMLKTGSSIGLKFDLSKALLFAQPD